LIYLRARWYNPADGRFLTKDPSGAESNLYLYAKANPVNRIDPSGLFSKEQIARSFGTGLFLGAINYYDSHGEHWGFLAALLRALPNDYIISEYVDIGGFQSPRRQGPARHVGYNDTQGITLDGIPLRTIYNSDGKENPTSGGGRKISMPWRTSDSIYYTVSDIPYRETYVDGPSKTDIPDFWGLSASYSPTGLGGGGGEGMYMVDRFGHEYITGGLSYSKSPWSLGAAYVEGYVNAPTGIPFNLNGYLPEGVLNNKLNKWGGCIAGEGSIFIGVSGAVCLNQTFMSMYSLGVQLNFGGGNFSPYTWEVGQNKSLAWDWVVQDMKGGVKRQQLTSIQENEYTGCNSNLPHLKLPPLGQ